MCLHIRSFDAKERSHNSSHGLLAFVDTKQLALAQFTTQQSPGPSPQSSFPVLLDPAFYCCKALLSGEGLRWTSQGPSWLFLSACPCLPEGRLYSLALPLESSANPMCFPSSHHVANRNIDRRRPRIGLAVPQLSASRQSTAHQPCPAN